MQPGHAVTPADRPSSRKWWAGAVAVIATVIGIVSGAIAIYEFVNRDTGPAAFTGTVQSAEGMREFLDFADDHDGELVRLDLRCVYQDGPMACVQQADPFDRAKVVLDLNDDPRCDPGREFACEGSVLLLFFSDGSETAQVDNGEYGAGSIVARGYFNLSKRGNLGTLPPGTTAIYLTAVSPDRVPKP